MLLAPDVAKMPVRVETKKQIQLHRTSFETSEERLEAAREGDISIAPGGASIMDMNDAPHEKSASKPVRRLGEEEHICCWHTTDEGEWCCFCEEDAVRKRIFEDLYGHDIFEKSASKPVGRFDSPKVGIDVACGSCGRLMRRINSAPGIYWCDNCKEAGEVDREEWEATGQFRKSGQRVSRKYPYEIEERSRAECRRPDGKNCTHGVAGCPIHQPARYAALGSRHRRDFSPIKTGGPSPIW